MRTEVQTSSRLAWGNEYLLPSLYTAEGRARLAAIRGTSEPVVIRQANPTSAARFEYEHPDLDDDPREDHFVMRDLTLAGRIAEEVEKHYPGHPWKIEVSTEYGIVQIRLQGLMNRHSYNCHVSALETDPHMKQLINGCGELLERYGLSRAKYSRDDFHAALNARPLWMRPADEVPGGHYSKRW